MGRMACTLPTGLVPGARPSVAPSSDPPGEAFVFNPQPARAPGAVPPRPPAQQDRRAALTERLTAARRDLALAEQAGRRSVLVRALQKEIAALEADLAGPDHAPPVAAPSGAPGAQA